MSSNIARPYKRVKRAFDRDALKRICEMREDAFPRAFNLDVTEVQGHNDDDFYAFRDNGSDILAVAHLDTVAPHAQRGAHYIDTASAGPVLYSRALDDRLGAYTILDLLPKLNINVDVLLTTGEETGNSTAQYFDPPKEYNWMIEFDRGGTDVVMYQYGDKASLDLVRASGARTGYGSFSDIAYLDHLEVKGFNWGVGYQDYHYARSHVYLEDYWMMLGHYLRFHAANKDVYLPHDKSANYRSSGGSDTWWRGPSTWSEAWRDYDMDADTEEELVTTFIRDAEAADGFEREELSMFDHDDDLVSEDFGTVNQQIILDS